MSRTGLFILISTLVIPSAAAAQSVKNVTLVKENAYSNVRMEGYEWTATAAGLEHTGVDNFLTSQYGPGKGDFTIKLQLSIDKLKNSGAALLLGNGTHQHRSRRATGNVKHVIGLCC